MKSDQNTSNGLPSEGMRLGGALSEGRAVRPSLHDRIGGSTHTTPPSPIVPARADDPGKEKNVPTATENIPSESRVRGLEALHFDHKVWLNSLRFFREELFIFQRHLEQFVRTSAVPETMAHVEQFQNKFIRQSEVMDELAHDIKQHDQALGEQMTGSSNVIYRPFGIHNELRERMEIFERLYHEMKIEFRSWLAYNR